MGRNRSTFTSGDRAPRTAGRRGASPSSFRNKNLIFGTFRSPRSSGKEMGSLSRIMESCHPEHERRVSAEVLQLSLQDDTAFAINFTAPLLFGIFLFANGHST